MNLKSPAVLEIDLQAIVHNINFFKSHTAPNTQFLLVVKAFAYGQHPEMIARFLQENQLVDYLAVAYADEGIALRKYGVTLPIMVLHPQIDTLEKIINHHLEPAIYDALLLKKWLKICEKNNTKNYPTHLKFNTGLNRLGFEHTQIPTVLKMLHPMKDRIKIVSIFSHLAASECVQSKDFTSGQIENFKRIKNKITELFSKKPMFHLVNTSGILNYPEAHFDMVRLGIGAYGFAGDKQLNTALKLSAHLKSKISQIKWVAPEKSIGYNRSFYTAEKTKIAVVAIGHADGIRRSLGNRGQVYIGGVACPIVGNVCMDMLMIDVTKVDCQIGDTVIVFENNTQLCALAKLCDTIPYEILTGIGARVERMVKSF